MLSRVLISWWERLFFRPNLFDWVFILIFSPLSLIFALFMFLRRVLTSKKVYDIPIVSIGNLTVGGSGKTPFVIALALRYPNVTIISRGYGRQSKGLLEVSREGKVLTDVYMSGDEPMLMAKSLKNSSVIVSENREKAIDLAIRQGAKLIILDDGFNRVNIKKFEILLFPKEIKNYMTFPSGPFRELLFSKKFANLNLTEEKEFKRIVKIENPSKKMLLVTAISNPERLEPYLPKDGSLVGSIYLEDHAYFDKLTLTEQLKSSFANTLLVTEKDEVKLESFDLPLSVMKLTLEIDEDTLDKIDDYVLK